MTDIQNVIETRATAEAATRALTTLEGLQGWWGTQTEIDGDAIAMTFVKEDRTVVMNFTVDEVVPGRRVRWTCGDNGNPIWPGTTLHWELASTGDGTTITFTHAGFREAASPPYKMTVEGWKHFCSSLQAYLDTGTGMPW